MSGPTINPGRPMAGPLSQIEDWKSLARRAGWSVADLARHCGVCTRTLERHFEETHHQTPEAWLAEQRWRLALELLLEGGSPKHVYSEVGYRHVSTFTARIQETVWAIAHRLCQGNGCRPKALRDPKCRIKLKECRIKLTFLPFIRAKQRFN